MRAKAWLLLSLGVNVLLGWALLSPRSTQSPGPVVPPPAPVVASPVYKTNVVVRRENFTWDQIESPDFKVYIANLRRIGCPEPTVRDIIMAEVDALFEKRRATEIVTPEQQWWRSDPDPAIAATATQQLDALEKERRQMLNDLLGPAWDKSSLAELAEFNFYLDGPVLGKLPTETKEAIRQVELKGAQRRKALLERTESDTGEADPRALAQLRQEARAELAKILTPIQLEEYLLRYSFNAQKLREETRGLGLNAEEFRKIFRASDATDQQLQLAQGGDATVKAREELERQREAAVREALGPERYALYRHTQDPLFRRAQTMAEELGAKPEAVLPLYQVNQAVEEERRRVRSDLTLGAEQRAEALERIVIEQEQSLRKILGDEAYEIFRARRDP